MVDMMEKLTYHLNIDNTEPIYVNPKLAARTESAITNAFIRVAEKKGVEIRLFGPFENLSVDNGTGYINIKSGKAYAVKASNGTDQLLVACSYKGDRKAAIVSAMEQVWPDLFLQQ